jgi:Ca2+-binding RTX toxin-like protein
MLQHGESELTFHLYDINELYSNADGSVQFIELTIGGFNGESFWGGHTITVTQGATVNSFTFPSDLPNTQTANRPVLIATQAFADLGIVTPNFIVPAGFLFTNGGTVNFAGADIVSYTSLPTDGTLSINRTGVTAVNSPTNFDLVTGSITGNAAPVPNILTADQITGAGQAFSLTLPVAAFTDANGDPLAYTATLADGSALPSWLSFDAGTRTFSGTPSLGDVGSFSLKVAVTDGLGGTASDTFGLDVISGHVLSGTSGDDNLSGTAQGDRIAALAGNDTLDGGAGNDTMTGGAGNDTYVIDTGSDVVIELSGEGTDLLLSSVTVAALIGNVENLTLTGGANIDATGNTAANAITGNSGNNLIDGAAGADTMTGGDGNDTYVLDNTGDVVIEQAGQGTDLVMASVTVAALAANVENLTLTGSANLNATGNSDANTISGNGGNNIIDGGGGADAMSGGEGNDSYVVDDAGDRVTETGAGIDNVASSVSFSLAPGDGQVLAGNIENLTLTLAGAIDGTGNALANIITGNTAENLLSGGGGNDTLAGGSGSDTLDGGAGDDRLDGGIGPDALSGGEGNDTYLIDDGGDTLTETGAGIDRVQSSVSFSLAVGDGDVLAGDVENLLLTLSEAIDGTGNSLANSITGNTGANRLAGGVGNDTLDGGGGADTLSGGAGDDNLAGGAGADVFLFADLSGKDSLRDFQSGVDRIYLDSAIFTSLAPAGVLDSDGLQFARRADISDTSGDNGSDGMQDYIKFSTSTGELFYDGNGTAAGGLQLIATLGFDSCLHAHAQFDILTAGDIVVV